jgi:hypothetical protein
LQDDRNSHTIHIYTGRQTSRNEGLTSSPPSVVV